MNKLIAKDEEQDFGQDNMTAIMIRLKKVNQQKRDSNNSKEEKKSDKNSA